MFAILPQVAMVNMQMFVSSPDLTTPHGGAPFQGWRKGRWPWGPGVGDQVPGAVKKSTAAQQALALAIVPVLEDTSEPQWC